MNIEISKMTEADIKNIAKIEQECFQDPWSEKSLFEELENTVADFFVAKIDGKTAGYIGSFNVKYTPSPYYIAYFTLFYNKF